MANPRFLTLPIILVIVGCAVVGTYRLEDKYGPKRVRERSVEKLEKGKVDYWTEVKPVFENRCVVCHGCYDAPCQLKLSSIEGVERGANPTRVYNSTRVIAAEMSRLHIDADAVEGWRDKSFQPVLNEYADTPEANLEASLMAQMLLLKQAHPLPEGKLLPDDFDLTLNRKSQSCPQIETFSAFERQNPLWGMPYALPALEERETETLLRWLEEGALYTARPQLAAKYTDRIAVWEKFFNGASLKEQLMSRYMFEHLFPAHFYFDQLESGSQAKYFEVVRSATPPGQPIELIVSRRPYDDPGVERVYYRIREVRGAILAKTHMPYALNEKRLARWTDLFLKQPYEVSTLPSYEVEVASNPFVAFQELPLRSRYKFMLDEAQFTIMGFIKGPVCRGQVALSVIQDHFWLFFSDPDLPMYDEDADFLASQVNNLKMPASKESDLLRPISSWVEFRGLQNNYLEAKAEFIHELFGEEQGEVTVDLFWDGDGHNPNAAVTIFRHFDSATVEQGLIGGPPETAWFISYSQLERIHYLLVAGYDVYGNLGHQLITRIYMDFLRMEGEMNFLYFLPEPARTTERDYWYRGADKEVERYLKVPRVEWEVETDISYQTDNPKAELYAMLQERLSKVQPPGYLLESISNKQVRSHLMRLDQLKGLAVAQLPQSIFVEVRGKTDSVF
ncbi:MAG: fatty acid cis/trans isomerase, partial [Deltaproteobacteria bacterium]|nr:fatty acid cis/trans isomerase [Deltaproteobacteria bacterium]